MSNKPQIDNENQLSTAKVQQLKDKDKNKVIEDDNNTPQENLSDFASPKRGPTLSTSTSSFEALDPHDPNLSHLATLMFSHTSNYLQVN